MTQDLEAAAILDHDLEDPFSLADGERTELAGGAQHHHAVDVILLQEGKEIACQFFIKTAGSADRRKHRDVTPRAGAGRRLCNGPCERCRGHGAHTAKKSPACRFHRLFFLLWIIVQP